MTTDEGRGAADVLVTGGSGLVGRWLVRSLLEAGRRVRVLSRVTRPAGQPGASSYVGDLTTGGGLTEAVRGCSAVFHCAAEKRAVDAMEAVNVRGTTTLFELADDAGVELFCHLSSVGVIGKTNQLVADEATPCSPMNAYETTKLAAERVVSRGLRRGRVVILRPTNVFDASTLGGLLDRSLPARIKWFLKGQESSHFVYVKDVAAAGAFFLDYRPAAPVETFIVSCDEEPRVAYREIQAIAATALASSPRPVRASAPAAVPYWIRRLRLGDTNLGNIVYSSRKLRAAGFNPPYGIEGGVRDALAASVKNI